jgi:acyl-CoA thioester hydrolase
MTKPPFTDTVSPASSHAPPHTAATATSPSPSPRPSSRAADFQHSVRVYWEDTDAGGVVFYANYLKFFERARTEWLRHLGLGQQALRDRTGVVFVVTDTQVSYRAPARLDDWLHVTVELRQQGTASMRIHQQAWREQTLLAQGDIRIGCVDAGTFKPVRVPNEVVRLMAPRA